jgi:glycosyltransferase involved in cell wall biosynthesis
MLGRPVVPTWSCAQAVREPEAPTMQTLQRSVSNPSRRCRILYLAGELHKGGLERQLYYLMRTIDRERYRPAIVVWNYRESDLYVPALRALDVPIYSLSTASSRVGKLRAFRSLVRELEPEVVHSTNFYTNFAASWGALGTKAVTVGSVRNGFVWSKKSTGSLIGRVSARWPAYQIYNSFAAAEEVRRARGFFLPRHVDVVSNGLDLETFRRCHCSMDGPAQILGIGYLLPQKRWDRLLRAASQLKRRGLDYRMRIVGGGPLRASLEDLAHRLEVADRVQFEPHSDDIPGLLAQSSFLAHTADNEGCPNAVMEAMACGRAVIGTDAGDIPHLIKDGHNGYVVPLGDEMMLVERMARLIVDRQLCSQMGEAGRLKAEREFGLDRLVAGTLATYRTAGWQQQ